MAENNNNQMNSGFNSNIGEENSLGFGTPPSGGPGFTPPQPETEKQGGIIGLSENEIKNPNEIVVTVSDPAPVVVLFGAKTSGKTMALIRLTRYLEKNGYQVVPDKIFRPSFDNHYKRMCNEYRKLCYNKYAPGGTEAISFMLIKILDTKGRPICQLLEAPGEHYFDEKDPEKPFPTYITNIMQLPNKRVWMFVVEQDGFNDDDAEQNGVYVETKKREMTDQEMRNMYVLRINNMPANLRRDKTIFVCHKVDKHQQVFLGNGMPNKPQIFKNIMNQYPGIFTRFKNRIPIYNWFKKYTFEFVPFSAGAFPPGDDGRRVYVAGEDIYPKLLWKAILKTLGKKQ